MRVFDMVASLGSITKAAEALGITQSTASAALKELQISLKRPPLFHRAGRSLQITAEGMRLQPIVRTLLLQVQEIEHPSKDTQLAGRLSVGLGDVSESVVAGLAAGFRRLNPRVRIDIVCGSPLEIAALLGRLVIDCMIISSLARVPGAELTQIYRERSVIIAHRDHPLSALAAPTIADLSDAEWCMPVRTTLSNYRMMEAFRDHITKFNVAMEINSEAAIRAAVLAGGGIAYLPFKVVEADLAAGNLTELIVQGIQGHHPVFFASMTNVQRSLAACAFDAYVLDAFCAGTEG